ncbi:hypothetical protein Tco_1512879, partial [Tanacetum coccineum]
SFAVRTRDQDDPHDDSHPEGENSAKRQKTSEYEAYVSGESSSFGQVNVEEPGDEHQYHIDQMKNFLQSDIVWESRKESLVSPHPRKITPLVQSCQRDHEAPALSLINQDLLYLKKGNSGPEKIVLSLHKFPAIVFNSRWVNKCIKKFNSCARYGFYQCSSGQEREKVMRPSEIHKFCDATLRRTLEGLKSYCNDVKYAYVQKELTNDEVEFLKLFEKDIEVRLKYRDQMRRWEMYVNGRPLGPRRERPWLGL